MTTTIRVSVLSNGAIRQGGAELIDAWSAERGDLLWVDIDQPTEEVLEPILEERFHFHELASEDALSTSTLPKYDRFTDYDFVIFRAVDVDLHQHGAQTYKLAAFLGRNFLFTVHPEPMRPVDDVCNRLHADARILGNGPDFLLYSIVDEMVDAHFPLLDRIEERVDDLQDAIFAGANSRHLDELLHLKRDLNVLRRISLPQRDLLNQLSRGAAQFIQQQHLIYFRDVYDHMFRISETIDVERDAMAGTMDAYLSVVSNRTNDIMKVLTILATIFMPPTLIAGIYGMNFAHMPELQWRHGYIFAVLLMIASSAALLLWFWQRGWLTRSTSERKRRSRSETRL